MRDLTPLLSPRSVAIIGASGNLDSLAGKPVVHLRDSGADIAVYPVNPRREEIGGYRCYPDIESLPEPPDLALVLTPASAVVASVAALGARGAKAAVVISSGFAETGADGARAQAELTALAAQYDMIVVGPNTLGVHDYRRGLPFSFVWYGRKAASPEGSIAVVTQSGSGMTSLCDRLLDLGLPLGYGISTGNEADLTVTDAIEFLAEQREVRVVATVFEELRDGPRFLAACRRLHERRVPLIALKLGRTESGSAVVQSHTGALAGSYPTLRAILRQYGVIEVEDLDDIGPMVAAALPGKFPAGNRLAVVTNSGGAAAICADRADELGLRLPPFSPSVQDEIRKCLPPFASTDVQNPIDLTAQSMEKRLALAEIAGVALEQSDIDAVVVGMPSGGGKLGMEISDRIVEIANASAKPLAYFILTGEEAAAQRQRQRDGGVACFNSPAKAVEAMSRLARFSCPARPAPSELVGNRPILERSGNLSEYAAVKLLTAYGIPVVEQRLAGTAAEAVAAAEQLGFPVAVKICSPDIAHKTDIGGVALGLTDATAVDEAFHAIIAAVGAGAPQAQIDGVTVAPMIAPGTELIAGIHRDTTFGPVLALGLGGIWAEVVGDVALRGLPILDTDVTQMLDELRGASLLRGARGTVPADRDKLTALMQGLVAVALDIGSQLKGIDLNPIVITQDGTPLVLDASIYLDEVGETGHPDADEGADAAESALPS